MPFIARDGDDTVVPEAVSDGVTVTCPACGEAMRPRGPFEDGRARHFFHINTSGGGDCGGESDPHRKMKSLAVSGLRQHFDDSVERCAPEVTLDVSDTPTQVDTRRADALLEFTDPDPLYGEGIIVEVQYHNHQKNVRATTHDYLTRGYSVYWASTEDFDEDRFRIDRLTAAFAEEDEPTAFAPAYSTPPPVSPGLFPASDGDSDGTVESQWTPTDLRADCHHEFIDEEMGDRCIRCGLKGQHRYYDQHREQYRDPDIFSVQLDNLEFVVYKPSLDYEPRDRTFEETGSTDHLHSWHRVSEPFGGTKYHCQRCAATMIVSWGKVYIDHDAGSEDDDGDGSGGDEWRPEGTSASLDDCEHDWEQREIARVCRKCGKEEKPWDT